MSRAKSEKMNQVLAVIAELGKCTAKEICDILEMSTREVSGLLKGLRMRGLIRIVETRRHSGNVWAAA